jgi:drug/metabolite transporter (DMT)-like permease
VLLAFSTVLDKKLDFLRVDRRTMFALVAGGIVALGLGWFFLTYSFVEILETRAVPISSTTPLFSTLAGIALLHEKITAKTALGSVVVVVGVFLIPCLGGHGPLSINRW